VSDGEPESSRDMARRAREGVGVLILRAWNEAEAPHFRARLTSMLDIEEEDDARTVAVATPDDALEAVAAWLACFSEE
jgi:hypothetical protein